MSAPIPATLLFFLVPLLPLLVLVPLRRSAFALAAAPWVPLSALLLLPLHGTVIDYPWLLLGARVGLDDIGLPLLLLAVTVWTAAGWHARKTIPAQEQPRFFTFWLATWCGTLSVFLTLDAASFYAAYAMMTFAAWGLVVHRRRREDHRAGRIYLVMALIGEALVLAGLFLVGAEAGNIALGPGGGVANLDAAAPAAALFAAGFGVKMALLGLHFWLPPAYTRAPAAASAVLAGVMLKAGLVGWLRFLPLGSDGFGVIGVVLVALGVVMAFYAVAAGLCARNPKTVLAWSSPSQMFFVTVPVGLALCYPEHALLLAMLAVAFAVHHGLAKAALFLGLDVARARPGLGRALLWLPAASLAGLPLTSGALAKAGFKSALPDAAGWLGPVVLLGSVATTLLMAHLLLRAHRSSRTRLHTSPAAPWLVLTGASLTLPWLLYAGVDPAAPARPFALAYMVESLAPVATGLAIVALVLLTGVHRNLPAVPRPEWPFRNPWATGVLPRPGFPRGVPSLFPDRLLTGTEVRLGRVAAALALWLLLLAALFLL